MAGIVSVGKLAEPHDLPKPSRDFSVAGNARRSRRAASKAFSAGAGAGVSPCTETAKRTKATIDNLTFTKTAQAEKPYAVMNIPLRFMSSDCGFGEKRNASALLINPAFTRR